MAKKPNYRVFIEQVNQTYVEVSAKNREEAREKGYRKWRKEDGHSRVMSVAEIGEKKKAGLRNILCRKILRPPEKIKTCINGMPW